jgi:muramidase (phage lysozyme)
MMLNLDRCRLLLADARIRAFLRVIRERESSQGDEAYRMRWPGLGKPAAYFDDFSQHPRIFEPTTHDRVSSAAGAYQITATTWDEIAADLGLTDFTPASQDLAAVGLLVKRGIVEYLLPPVPDFDGAVTRARATWTSLPGASESSSTWTMDRARYCYDDWLRLYRSDAQPAAPIEDRSTPARPEDAARVNRKEAPVAPIIIPLLSAISAFVPALAKIFNDGSAKGQKIEALAPLLSDALVRVTGAVNLQDAAEKVQADPVAAQAAQKAVEDVVYHLSEVGGGIEAARKWSTDVSAMNVSLWRMPSFVITVILFPLIYFVVFIVLAGRGTATMLAALITTNTELLDRIAIGFAISADMQNVVITAVIAGVLSGITGFFLGTSYGSQRKTDSVPR